MASLTTPGLRLLPVSILFGPAARSLTNRIAADKSGLAVLTRAGKELPGPAPVVLSLLSQDDPAEIIERVTALSQNSLIDRLIIECSAETSPLAFASLFLPQDDPHRDLSQVTRLASITLAINANSVVDLLIHEKEAPGLASACVLADEIEVADSITFEDEVDSTTVDSLTSICRILNPRAKVSAISAASSKRLFNNADFDFAAAFEGAGWRKLIDGEGAADGGPEGATSLVYRARRPFHPERFWSLLQGPFRGVFRAKGFFWLATRNDAVGGLNYAGGECRHAPAGQWWAVRGDLSNMPERTKKEWAEPFGDRRQAIAFMGLEFDRDALKQQLDACLLRDLEMVGDPHAWNGLPDPFPSWSKHSHHHECNHDDGHDHDHDCGHEHESQDHSCCHH